MKRLFTTLTCILTTFCSLPVLNAQVCFSPKITTKVDIDPISICSADFNGDGKQDLAVAYKGGGASHVSVYLNNGLAGFSSQAYFSVGVVPTAISSADFDGDGKLDIVTNNAGPGTITVFLGKGNGTFDTIGTQTYATLIFNSSARLSTADFSGDANPDVIVSSGSNFIWKAIGNGLGGFSTYRRIVADNNTHCLANADFNGDGQMDIAVTTFNVSSHVSVLLNMGTDSFSAATNFSIGAAPTSLICTDLNGDGNMDLATSNTAGTVSVLLGNGFGGFGTATSIGIGTATEPRMMCTGDFNNDGKKDLALACVANNSSSNITVLQGNGSGSFGPAVIFATDSFANGIVAADFNSDGRMDLVQSSGITNNDSGRLSLLLGCIPTAIKYVAAGKGAHLYPNPSDGLFHIDSETEITRITIINQLGEVVYTSMINSKKGEVDLTARAKGLYFYRLENKDGVLESGKVLVR